MGLIVRIEEEEMGKWQERIQTIELQKHALSLSFKRKYANDKPQQLGCWKCQRELWCIRSLPT